MNNDATTLQYPEQDIEGERPVERAGPTPAAYEAWQFEANRRTICNAIIVIYYLLILEGALRKWIAPGYQKELFFVRDPFLLFVYGFALLKGFWPKASVLFWCGLGLAVVGFNLTLWHLEDTSVTLMAYGWRNYFAYLPLAFIIGEQFRYGDWLRVVRFTILISIPVAVLCVLQSVSSPTAPINAGFGVTSDELFVPFGVAGEVIRATGFFTSGTGQVQFIGSLAVMLFWMWSDTRIRHLFGRWALPLAAVATIVLLVVGGHRAGFLLVGLVAIAGTMMSFAADGIRSSSRLAFGLALLGALILFSGRYFFRQQAEAMVQRTQVAAEEDNSAYSAGVVNRTLNEFGTFADFVPIVDWTGAGLGVGGNAGDILGANSRVGFAEDDWSRNVVDLGPIAGLAFIAYRIALVLMIASGAVAASRRYRDPLPLLLISFVGITLLNGQITGQGSVNGYGWIFVGFCLAANAGHLSLERSPTGY